MKDKGIIIVFIILLLLIILLPMFMLGKNNDRHNGQRSGDTKSLIKETFTKVNEENKKIKVYISEEKTIKELDIEDYVKGVVAAEMPVSFNIEALKAQAVAVRNFTINRIRNKCGNGNGADICDTVHCQVYIDKNKKIKEWGNNGQKNWSKLEEAVNSTKGQYMYYNGELVLNAQYFSASWGKTEDSKVVFGDSQPYLSSVKSLGDSLAPKYSTTSNIDNKTFVNKIKNKYNISKLAEGNLSSNVKIASRNESGSVKSVSVCGKSISGVEFRKLFDLNSTNFTMTFSKNSVVVKCLGYGHGVGMSQWGANYMANDGKTYIEILKYYYSGVIIK